MGKGFLGQGWGFPLQLNTDGTLVTSSEAQKIQESIWIILTTVPGERVMREDFGCGIHTLVFENTSVGFAGRVAQEVTQSLIRWEPRVDVRGVDVTPDEQEPGLMLISIDYVIRSTNSRFNLVYPFYTA